MRAHPRDRNVFGTSERGTIQLEHGHDSCGAIAIRDIQDSQRRTFLIRPGTVGEGQGYRGRTGTSPACQGQMSSVHGRRARDGGHFGARVPWHHSGAAPGRLFETNHPLICKI